MSRIILDPVTRKFTDTGEPIRRFPHSEETKRKMSISHKGKYRISGWHHSEETKRKIGIAQQGKYISEETKQKISVATKKAMEQYCGENHPMFGKHHSEESKEKMRLASTGRVHSEETKARLSTMGLGHPTSNETKEKISKSILARYQNPEYASKKLEAQGIKPNKTELYLQDILDKYSPGEWKYVGDGQLIIGGKCPDFTNVNGKKELIELYGRFYHRIDEAESRIAHFKRYGFRCIVLWEEELKNEPALIRHIRDGRVFIPSLIEKTIYDYKEGIDSIILDPVTKRFATLKQK